MKYSHSDVGTGALPSSPTSIPNGRPSQSSPVTGCPDAARHWFTAGLRVIPIVPGEKRTVIGWDSWLEGLSAAKVAAHWNEHPEHEVGVIAGEEVVVFDADGPDAQAALEAIESRFGIVPNMVVKTRRGWHHYYRRAPGSFARSDSHSTEQHPDRIDVRTGRALVVLPPSGGRQLVTSPLASIEALVEIRQEVIDAVFVHNGRMVPRPRAEVTPPKRESASTSPPMGQLAALVSFLNPNCGYEDWVAVAMVLHHETEGSVEGLELFDSWSRGGTKYPGRAEIERKWRGFQREPERPRTVGTLKRMVADAGGDWVEICNAAECQFEPCDTVVVQPGEEPERIGPRAPNPLERYSLLGRSEDLERVVVDQTPLLGQVALSGQATIWYAAPNTGKTLISLALIIDAIVRKRLDPADLFYVNVDDTSSGLLQKNRIAEEYGFHMVGDGHLDFEPREFARLMAEMCEADQARGIVVVADTLKKFVDLMDKGRSSAFMKVIRRFVSKGGTFIGLAHTNKNPGADGKPVYGGTSDFRDDADCVFTIAPVGATAGGGEKTVVFENIKRRGDVAHEAAYSYSSESGISYYELLASVRPIDQMQLPALKVAEAARSDADLIAVVRDCIQSGINAKMRLADAVATQAGVSKRTAIRIIEKYAGADPSCHRWQFTVQARGAKVFVLLDRPATGLELREPTPTEGGPR